MLAWKFKTEGKVYSSSVVTDNMVFFGSNDGYIYTVK
ncbi:MAG: PQQ-binding-like beta-propeller repeat protein [Spirochaetales bacterium]|nr:PQQ-binding-like beta-propeller repeat protein [Spirochaetales bacterium]